MEGSVVSLASTYADGAIDGLDVFILAEYFNKTCP